MIEATKFLKCLIKEKISFYTGVPDSVLKNFTQKLDENNKVIHLKAPNEGAAVSLAIGNYLSSSKIPCVYLQNSGLSNAMNPLISIANSKVYSIPILIIIGWRGAPSLKDEPQHEVKGKITISLLRLMKIDYVILETNDQLKKIHYILRKAKKKKSPVAILIKNNTFKPTKIYYNKKFRGINRLLFLKKLLSLITKKTKIISTTGYTSRELDFLRKTNKYKKGNDFYVVGGMGHASMVSLGMLNTKKSNIICLDGDGSILMHLGSMRTIGYYGNYNFKHILLNNGCHESVGGQISTADGIDFKNLSKSLGYKRYFILNNENDIQKKLKLFLKSKGPNLLEVIISRGTIENLSRPNNFIKIKKKFMK